MPRPDPLPAPGAADRNRLRYAIRLVAAFGLVIAVIACVLVASGEQEIRPHMLIATALGAFLTIFIGGSLMLLVFFSNASGHDDSVADARNRSDEDSK